MREEKYTPAEKAVIREIIRKGYVSAEISGTADKSALSEEEKLKPKQVSLGKGLVAKRDGNKNSYTIYKNAQEIAHTEYCPLNGYEDSGKKYFLCVVNGGNGRRFMDNEGNFCFAEYGPRTDNFMRGYARIQRKDGTYGFINLKGQDIGLVLKEATSFVYDSDGTPVAHVKFNDAKNKCYINPKGEVVNTPRLSSQAYLDELAEESEKENG